MSDIIRDDPRWYRTTICADGEPGCIDSHLMTDAETLRALLTDECKRCDGEGESWEPKRHTCPDCGGRGWLPKDGVQKLWGKDFADPIIQFPAEWLEAEDE